MNYRVLIVDDEPMIVSGIKFMIDWEEQGCTVVGTARNGKQALEAIEELHPHIVICDITMPIYNGIDVIKNAAELENPPVFIMLTNHAEFQLVQQAMRYNAIDYLIKTNLDPDTLIHSLVRAKNECIKLGNLSRINTVDEYLKTHESDLFRQYLKQLLLGTKTSDTRFNLFLQEKFSCKNYMLVHIMLDYLQDELPNDDIKTRYKWQCELADKLATSCFSYYRCFDLTGSTHSITLFAWNLADDEKVKLERFYNKLSASSDDIMGIKVSLVATDCLPLGASFADAQLQLTQLGLQYYLSGCVFLPYRNISAVSTTTLETNKLENKFLIELHAKNINACATLLTEIAEQVEKTNHTPQQALDCCLKLHRGIFLELPEFKCCQNFISLLETDAMLINAHGLALRKKDVLNWLTALRSELVSYMEQAVKGKSEVLDKACQYIRDNVEKRIMLQDVADYINFSATYLSGLFKKTYNQSLIEYINSVKIERACALIHQKKYHIYEISAMLSFENPYYFSKVFKRHTGYTPTEYLRLPPN